MQIVNNSDTITSTNRKDIFEKASASANSMFIISAAKNRSVLLSLEKKQQIYCLFSIHIRMYYYYQLENTKLYHLFSINQ